jgi:hypothetical protein
MIPQTITMQNTKRKNNLFILKTDRKLMAVTMFDFVFISLIISQDTKCQGLVMTLSISNANFNRRINHRKGFHVLYWDSL